MMSWGLCNKGLTKYVWFLISDNTDWYLDFDSSLSFNTRISQVEWAEVIKCTQYIIWQADVRESSIIMVICKQRGMAKCDFFCVYINDYFIRKTVFLS